MTTRTKAPHLALVALLLSACATTTPSSNLAVGSPYFIRSFERHEVRRDVMNRYMCVDGQPLTCSCSSPISPKCDCTCRPFGPAWNSLLW